MPVQQYGWCRRKIGQVKGGDSTAYFQFFDLRSMELFSLTVLLYCHLLSLTPLSEDFAFDWRYTAFKRLLISSVRFDCLKEDYETIIIAKV